MVRVNVNGQGVNVHGHELLDLPLGVDMTRFPVVAARPVLVALGLGLCLSTPLMAQRSDRGTIGGVVTDPQGGALPGATVSIRNDATGVETVLTTNSAGAYTSGPLVLGPYTVTVSLAAKAPDRHLAGAASCVTWTSEVPATATRMVPVPRSRMRNKKGWSARNGTGSSRGAAAPARNMVTAVAAAASVPFSSTFTNALWKTRPMTSRSRGSFGFAIPVKSAFCRSKAAGNTSPGFRVSLPRRGKGERRAIRSISLSTADLSKIR